MLDFRFIKNELIELTVKSESHCPVFFLHIYHNQDYVGYLDSITHKRRCNMDHDFFLPYYNQR
jgi:hypothetical protein